MILPFREWRRLCRRALAAQRKDKSEVCGLIARYGDSLSLEFLKNLAGPGCWSLDIDVIEQTLKRMNASGLKVIGTFHSHPISEPIPGPRDIEAMIIGEGYQLIYDVCGIDARLWHRNKSGVLVNIPLVIHKMPGRVV